MQENHQRNIFVLYWRAVEIHVKADYLMQCSASSISLHPGGSMETTGMCRRSVRWAVHSACEFDMIYFIEMIFITLQNVIK